MKKLFLVLFLLIPLISFSQDSLKYKELLNDKQELSKSFEEVQNNVEQLKLDVYGVEQVIGYNRTLDTAIQRHKDDFVKLSKVYEQLKKNYSDFQIKLYVLKGYLEYNSLLLSREAEKFKK